MENNQWLYKHQLLDENQWIRIANELYRTANNLESQVKKIWKNASMDNNPDINNSFIAIYFMLASYVIENYLKGIIIQKEKKKYKAFLENKCELPSDLKNHDLPSLAKKAGLEELDVGKFKILERLSQCAIWHGRYPVPAKPKDFPFTEGFNEFDMDIIKEVIGKIKEIINSLRNN